MRELFIALLSALFLLTGCSGGEDPATPQEDAEETESEVAEAPPVRGELEVSAEPMAMADLPETPEAGSGVAVLDGETYPFTVTFCDETGAIGSGEGDGVEVNWNMRDDGDHRVNVRVAEGEQNWVRGGPAEGEWDPASRVVRFAGAFVPFRAETGEEARSGGIVVACPPAEG